jgi:hypothetical protein
MQRRPHDSVGHQNLLVLLLHLLRAVIHPTVVHHHLDYFPGFSANKGQLSVHHLGKELGL